MPKSYYQLQCEFSWYWNRVRSEVVGLVHSDPDIERQWQFTYPYVRSIVDSPMSIDRADRHPLIPTFSSLRWPET